MKLNWKIRIRNPVFWLTAVPSISALLFSLLGLLGKVPFFTEDMLIKVLSTVISLLSTLGVLIDPTTKGLCDSEDVLCKNGKKQ